MNRHVTRASTVAAVLVVPLMVFVVPAGFAGASPAVAASGPSNSWAYGAVKNVSFSGTTGTGWEWSLSGTYGYTVVLNEPNPTANPFEVTVNRTMGVSFSYVACRPSCSDPSIGKGTVSYHAFESSATFANFTSTGSVFEGSTAVPALALLNSSSISSSNLSTSAALYAARGLVNWSAYFAVATHSGASVSFSTPLGLIPLNLSAPQSWNDTAGFSAIGATTYSFYAEYAKPTANGSVGPISGALTLAGSGNVTVLGNFGGRSISFNGVSYPILSLQVMGPFSVREGFILLPSAGDLFASAGGTAPWTADQTSLATAGTSTVDARPFSNGHLGIGASSWVYQSISMNPGDSVNPPEPSPAVVDSPMAAAATEAPAVTVQGAPLDSNSVAPINGCLESGVGCPSAAGGSPARPFLALLGLGVVAVAVVAVIGTVLVVERRRPPAPVYPNANLYPPGAAGGPMGGRPARAPGSPPAPPSEDDPLNHLW
jgi:hypothetical protein